jgi:sugar phosphate isomerase/epimerase
MLQFAVSTWSVHRLLGITYANGPGDDPSPSAQPTFGKGELSLMALPAALKRRGYDRAEICHFHLASHEPGYLGEVRDAFQQSGVTIQTLLIDDGDITNPATRERDMAWIGQWIEAAGHLGARHVRVIAGKSKPTPEALALSVDGLRSLAKTGAACGVRIVTENWFDTLSSPSQVHHVLDAVGSDLGFLADTGNWSGPGKYAALASVFPRAGLCHAKCSFGPALDMDSADYGKCLQAAADAGYAGPFTLIFESEGDEWQGLETERQFVMDFLRP